MCRGGLFPIRRRKGRKDRTVLSGIQNSSASWKTAGWRGRANGKGFPVLGHRFENNAVEFQWEDFCLHLENIRRPRFPGRIPNDR